MRVRWKSLSAGCCLLYTSDAAEETFLSKRPQRAVEELQEELRRIGEQVKSCAVPSFAWERAVIGKNDLIFTAVNQRNAWTGTEVAEYDIPHYSEEIMRDLLCPSVI